MKASDYTQQAEYCRDRAEVCRINGSPDADRWTFEASLYDTWAREAIEAARVANA